jgi:hypothetical protein
VTHIIVDANLRMSDVGKAIGSDNSMVEHPLLI